MQTKSEPRTEYELRVEEDDKMIYFFYKEEGHKYCLAYSKDKDKCDVLKDGKLAKLSLLTDQETERYKEVLDIAINYHHDRDGEYLN